MRWPLPILRSWGVLAATATLGAADLATTLRIEATANLDGPVTATWATVERPAGSGAPVLTPAPEPDGRYAVRVDLPEPQVGRYVFRVVLTHDEAPTVVQTVQVEIEDASAPAPPASGSGGGCGGGGASALALVLLLLGLSRGMRS